MANSNHFLILRILLLSCLVIFFNSCSQSKCEGCENCEYEPFIDSVSTSYIEFVSASNDITEPIKKVVLKSINNDSVQYTIEGQFLHDIKKDFETFQFQDFHLYFALIGQRITNGTCPPYSFDSIYVIPNNCDFIDIHDTVWNVVNSELSGTLNLTQVEGGGNLVGSHQFVNSDGSRIDYCENTSIYLSSVHEGTWEGLMKDCYFESVHSIKLSLLEDDKLQFLIEDNEHIFLPDTFVLTSTLEAAENYP